jgi:hypothetical protein
MFGELLKAAVGVITVPVAVVADVVTLGGTLTEGHTDSTYTGDTLSKVWDNLEKATK